VARLELELEDAEDAHTEQLYTQQAPLTSNASQQETGTSHGLGAEDGTAVEQGVPTLFSIAAPLMPLEAVPTHLELYSNMLGVSRPTPLGRWPNAAQDQRKVGTYPIRRVVDHPPNSCLIGVDCGLLQEHLTAATDNAARAHTQELRELHATHDSQLKAAQENSERELTALMSEHMAQLQRSKAGKEQDSNNETRHIATISMLIAQASPSRSVPLP
jgi:hypothetical protein